MSNIIKRLTASIEKTASTTKTPCKLYASEAAAEKATAKMAQQAATYFDAQGSADAQPADYLVFYVESLGKWVGCINLTELLRRKNSTGGYLGICTGFFVW